MATPTLLPPPRRSCAESLAARAWASKPRTYRSVPKSPRWLLEELLDHPALYPVHRRLIRRALESFDATAIAHELRETRLHLARKAEARAELARVFPRYAESLAA